MNTRFLKNFTYIYLILPIIVFIFGWVKLKFSIILIFLLIVIIRKIIKESEENDNKIITNRKNVAIIFFIVCAICSWGGLGGFSYQSSDWNYRNAIFRDLINFKWPVFYENTNSALTYYIGIWMIPALVGKFFGFFGENIAWRMGNIALLIWCSIGITLSILWLVKLFNVQKLKKVLLVLIIFLGFSGLDVIGNVLVNYDVMIKINPDLVLVDSTIDNEIDERTLVENSFHIERWAHFFQFSSMITQIFWVFNQSIVPWLITIIFIDEKKVNKYVLLILICIVYGPLPAVGLILLMIARGIKFLIDSIRTKRLKEFVRNVFSLENILALISIFPIYALYYTNNSAINDETGSGLRIISEVINPEGLKLCIKFYIIEIGIYGGVLLRRYKNNELFIVSLISLLFIPLIAIGNAYDFGMRASIPALLVIDYYFVEFILETLKKRNQNALREKINAYVKLSIVFLIFVLGFVTPMVEFSRKIIAVENNFEVIEDNVGSLDKKNPEDITNFVCINPKENSIFFKYIAK